MGTVPSVVPAILPKGTDLSVHSTARLDTITDELNGRSHTTLGFKTRLKPPPGCSSTVNELVFPGPGESGEPAVSMQASWPGG